MDKNKLRKILIEQIVLTEITAIKRWISQHPYDQRVIDLINSHTNINYGDEQDESKWKDGQIDENGKFSRKQHENGDFGWRTTGETTQKSFATTPKFELIPDTRASINVNSPGEGHTIFHATQENPTDDIGQERYRTRDLNVQKDYYDVGGAYEPRLRNYRQLYSLNPDVIGKVKTTPDGTWSEDETPQTHVSRPQFRRGNAGTKNTNTRNFMFDQGINFIKCDDGQYHNIRELYNNPENSRIFSGDMEPKQITQNPQFRQIGGTSGDTYGQFNYQQILPSKIDPNTINTRFVNAGNGIHLVQQKRGPIDSSKVQTPKQLKPVLGEGSTFAVGGYDSIQTKKIKKPKHKKKKVRYGN